MKGEAGSRPLKNAAAIASSYRALDRRRGSDRAGGGVLYPTKRPQDSAAHDDQSERGTRRHCRRQVGLTAQQFSNFK
jgi:hypothetical protein